MRSPLRYAFAAAACMAALQSDAALHDRGGGLIYDDILNVTWLQDANLASTQRFGIPVKGSSDTSFVFGIAPNGAMNYATASAWIEAMNGISYLGHSDWRLPITLQPDPTCSFQGSRSSGVNCTGAEMGSLYYIALGHPFAVVDYNTNNVISPDPILTPGPLLNLQPDFYWSSTPYLPDNTKFFFNFHNGFEQDYGGQYTNMFVLALRDGDVAPVPEPSTFALFLGGLGLLGWIARRRPVNGIPFGNKSLYAEAWR
jgi:hypothetical protein